MTKPKRPLPDLSIQAAIDQFAQDLRIDKSPATIRTYTEAGEMFRRFAAEAEVTTLSEITPNLIREYVLAMRVAGNTDSTIVNRYSGLRALLTWATEDGQLAENPIKKVPAPRVKAKPIPMLTIDHLKAMLRQCDNSTFEGIRDTAIIRLLADTGMRRMELRGLRAKLMPDGSVIGDLNFDQDVAVVHGKGGKTRACPFGPKTAKALRRYLRARYIHPHGDRAELWLGRKGPVGDNAILSMLRRRGRQAKVPGRVFVHQIRHTWAHESLMAGLQEGDVMRLGGWADRTMLSRYGAAGADERAIKAYRAASLGDKL